MVAREVRGVKEQYFNLSENETVHYSLLSMEITSSPYKPNWISNVETSKEKFLLCCFCLFDQKTERILPMEFGKLHTKI